MKGFESQHQTGLSFDDPILGLDISEKCIGWAMLRGRHYETGHCSFGGKDVGTRLYHFQKWLRDMIRQNMPAVVANEQPFLGKPSAIATLYRYHGIHDMVMSQYIGMPYPVHAPTWKAKVCGNGRLTTKDKMAGAVLTCLANRGFHVAQIDEGDALSVALCARVEMFGRLK